MLSYIFILLGVFLSALLLTGVMRYYAAIYELMDVPNERSSHNHPIPRGGGVSFVLVFLSFLIFIWSFGSINFNYFLAIFCSGLVVAIVGFWDDHGHLAQSWRIMIHIISALWAVYWIWRIVPQEDSYSTPLPELIWLLFSVLSLIWLLNLFNFMDGIDGLAGSEAIFIALVGGWLAWMGGSTEIALLFFVLAASVLGFLMWNWPPAKIFMGDVGSGFLGCVLGILAYITVTSEVVPFWPWCILSGTFLVDASITLLRRMTRGDRWYKAHCTHAYQHAARRWGHLKVTLLANTINYLWLMPMALLAYFYPQWGWAVAVLALTPLVIFALKLDAGIPLNDLGRSSNKNHE